MYFSCRFNWANECRPHSSSFHGQHDGPPLSHQHLQAFIVPHVHPGLTNEWPGVALSRHHVISGITFCTAAVCAQHELWTSQQPTGQKMGSNENVCSMATIFMFSYLYLLHYLPKCCSVASLIPYLTLQTIQRNILRCLESLRSWSVEHNQTQLLLLVEVALHWTLMFLESHKEDED